MSVEFQFQYQNRVELSQDMARRLTDSLAKNKALEAENKRLREDQEEILKSHTWEQSRATKMEEKLEHIAKTSREARIRAIALEALKGGE